MRPCHTRRVPCVQAAPARARARRHAPRAAAPPLSLDVPRLPLAALRHPSVAHFVNVTNGLEAVPLLASLAIPFSMCRLTSTSVEQARWASVAAAADAALVGAAVAGYTVLVWDAGARASAESTTTTPLPPRALRTGLPFLRFALERALFRARGRDARPLPSGPPYQRGHDASAVFASALADGAVDAALGDVRCWRRLAPPAVAESGLRFMGAHRRAAHDGDLEVARSAFGGLRRGGVVAGAVGRGGGRADVDAAALSADLASVGWFLWTEADERPAPGRVRGV